MGLGLLAPRSHAAVAEGSSTAPIASAARSCPGADLRPSAPDLPAVGAATLCLVNQVRAAAHVPPVNANLNLARVAAGQVRQMVRLDYFADVRPTGQTPLALVMASHYGTLRVRVSVGQNIAWGTGSFATPASIVAAWMASPPHRAIMLDGKYRDAGVGAVPSTPRVIGDGRGGATYAIEFGLRQR